MRISFDRAGAGQFGFALVGWPADNGREKYEVVLLVWRWTASLFLGMV